MEPTRRIHPGAPRRADAPDPTPTQAGRAPRVPPNGVPYAPPRPAPVAPGAAREEATPVGADGATLSSAFERVDLPSGFALYAWQDLSVRRVEPLDHAKITRASRHKNLSVMLDVMASMANRDVRDFCVSDFYALCQWHKTNSYPASGTTITWTSRYGSRVTEKVKKTELETIRLDKTRTEYLAWNERGLAAPTMRDLEMLDTLQDEDVATMFQRAQFVHAAPLAARISELRRKGDTSPTVTARVEELQRRGMAFYAEIDEFAAEFSDFGVNEYCWVTNTKWNVEQAIETLRASEDPERIAEANEIEDQIARGETPAPRKERVPLMFNLWGMFPWV